jgi:hypothetical protein
MVRALLSFALALLFGGCATGIGPRLIQSENLDYNQQIVRSLDEQLLLNLVRTRYVDTPLFLEMGNVVVQYAIEGRANLGADPVVVGPRGSERLPMGIGAGYAERPTITYSPLQGEQFARRLLTPISAETIVLLSQSGWPIDLLLMVCVQRINGVENAIESAGLAPSDHPRYQVFEDVARRLRTFQRMGELSLSLEMATNGSANLIRLFPRMITNNAVIPDAFFIRDALKMDMNRRDFILRNGGHAQSTAEIAIDARSLAAVMGFMAKGVEVPQDHIARGLVPLLRDTEGHSAPLLEPASRYFHVHHSATRPSNASIKVQHRGHWFYLSDEDIPSRVAFALLHTLFSLQTASGNGRQPLLTIPAGP